MRQLKASNVNIGKTILQQNVRWFHARFFCKPLPTKLGIYFHELETKHYGAIRELVDSFRGEGYRFTGDPSDFIAGNEDPVVFLSIDDNFQSTFHLLDLADELDVRFAVYLNTMFFRDRDDNAARNEYLSNLCSDISGELLSRDEVRAIAASGHTIGAHSHSHRQLSSLPREEGEAEIRRCKLDLEELLGQAVNHFSYPFGMRRHFNESLRGYCREIGIETVANAIPGLQHTTQAPYAIQRTGWMFDRTLQENITNLQIDGRIFERLTGRSAVV